MTSKHAVIHFPTWVPRLRLADRTLAAAVSLRAIPLGSWRPGRVRLVRHSCGLPALAIEIVNGPDVGDLLVYREDKLGCIRGNCAQERIYGEWHGKHAGLGSIADPHDPNRVPTAARKKHGRAICRPTLSDPPLHRITWSETSSRS